MTAEVDLPKWVWDVQDEGVLLLDERRRVVAANRAAGELLGVAREALTGTVIAAPPAVPDAVRAQEHARDGLTAVTLRDVGRELAARRAVERIAESVAEFLFTRRLQDDGTAKLVYASPGIERLLGGPVPPGRTMQDAWLEAIHPADWPQVAAGMQETLEARGGHVALDYRMVGLDGRVRWVRSRTQLRHEGEDRYIDGIVSDVTAEHEHHDAMARFRAVVEASGSAIAVLEPDWRVRWMNSAGLEMLGTTADRIAGVPYLELVGDEARVDHLNVERPAVDAHGRWSGPSVLLPQDRSRRPLPVEATTYRITHPTSGEHLGLACIRRDVSDARRLVREHEAIGHLATAIAEGVGLDQLYEAACRETARLLGADAGGIATLLGADARSARRVGTWRASGVDDRLELAIARLTPGLAADGGGAATGAWALELDDGHHGIGAAVVVEGRPWGLIVACRHGTPFSDEDERALARLGGLVGMGVGVATTRQALVRQAMTDGLTGLLHHRAFHEALRAEAERATRYGHPLALILLDLDGFKDVNDAHGHQAGDRLLVVVARALEETTRASETVGRLGGDEFAVLLPETGLGGARATAERIRAAVAAHRVTISAGVAELTADGPDDLVRRADRALYRSKAAGRDRVSDM
jgi:diguanylate cyclase (GGDEF)-like protein/PAS domain S-box-containing protein